MNPALFTDRYLAVVASRSSELEFCIQELGVSKTRTTREDTRNCAHRGKCESWSIAKSSSRTEYAPSALKSSLTTTMWCRTIKTRKEWAEPGETTTQTTCRQRIGGAIQKRDQPEWKTNGRSAGLSRADRRDLLAYQQLADDYARTEALDCFLKNPRFTPEKFGFTAQRRHTRDGACAHTQISIWVPNDDGLAQFKTSAYD